MVYFDSKRRASCAIEVPSTDQVVITGGRSENTVNSGNSLIPRVQVFNINGATHQLPDMLTSRMDHACGYYHDDKNELVCPSLCPYPLFCYFPGQTHQKPKTFVLNLVCTLGLFGDRRKNYRPK